MKTDIEIAQSCTLLPITAIGAKLGLTEEQLECYGRYKAKIDPQLLKDMMERCRQARDYEGLFMLQCHAAEAALWETEHNARWLATLDTVRQAWQAHLAG